jgi:hypothetical protein
MERKRNEESLPETQGFVHHNVVERYAPNGRDMPLTGAICSNERDILPVAKRYVPNGARYALRRDILPAAKRYAPNGAWKTKTFYFL